MSSVDSFEPQIEAVEIDALQRLDRVVDQLRIEQQRLETITREDALTGLLNRTAMINDLNAEIASLAEGAEIALLYFDLDNFKPVNDTLGHPAGDRVLQTAARRLIESIRDGDRVARMGGDEFAILQINCPQPSSSRALAKRVIQRLNEAIVFDEQHVHIGVSVGVAIGPFDGDTSNELLKNADLAMYRAKQDGRGVLRYFETEMDARMQARRKLENELRLAIKNQEFELHFQPVLDLTSEKIVLCEALVRWNHPQLGRVAPDQFIPLSEKTGLIGPLGAWVLRRACQEAVTWGDDICVSVNVSPIQLRDRTLVQTVDNILDETGLKANRLELEITERSLMSNTDLTVGLLHQLRKLGVRISMDDFGTGYSSISYLRKFPFDKIKIDRSFVTGSDTSDDSAALVKMIASLGASLGVKTTAEGVETCAEMKSVRDAGCTEIQRYLLSRPISSDSIRELLHDRQTNGNAVTCEAN
ncbi:Phytochrome-like protein cph2 [Rubripirellula tenax]|uniref:Phytochrome-like protein cph2 n=2 Tax=Rubripirellula tenax TaxID=2528015 RepID=A0A5C6EFG7_9BACT|nr:Phytochrome-like protein cph2 [Rubripirellula tenax]